MNTLKAWTVCLDLSITDFQIVKNVALLAQRFTPSQINFIHVATPSDLPSEVLREIPDLHFPELISYHSKIEDLVAENLPAGPEVYIEVLEGNAISELLKFCNTNESDLLIVGKKLNGNGAVSKKLARKAPCNILFIPEIVKNEIKSILIPTDFSNHSEMALKMALEVSKRSNNCKLNVLNVYKDASKYLTQAYETAYEVNEAVAKKPVLDQKLSQYASHQLGLFVKPFNNDQPDINQCTLSINRDQQVADAIHQWTEDHSPDLILIGAKGLSSTAATLLGSVSEQVYKKQTNTLILVVKAKGENKGLLKVLLGI